MFTNTGNLSFYLGIFFILISFVGIIFIYKVIKKGTIEKEKIDKLIEIGKWFIVSVAIVLSTSIINDGFREREQDIKELEFFDKYTKTVTDANGLEQTWLMCEFFLAVSPEGDLKDAWGRYMEVLEPKYNEYIKNKEIVTKSASKDTLTKEEEKKVLQSKQKIQELDNLYSSINREAETRSKYNSALYWEEKAFKSLIDKKLDSSILFFYNSEQAYNSYHQVYEIHRFLKKTQPKSEQEWNAVYDTILKDYSWGMPSWAKNGLIEKNY